MTVQTLPIEMGVYLRTYLRPFSAWLDRPDVTEIIVNKPGEVWIERSGQPRMERIAAPEIDEQLLQRLAMQIARTSHQGINRENPLLGATLASGERVQIVASPATRAHMALAIRRHVLSDMALEDYGFGSLMRGRAHNVIDPHMAVTDPLGLLRTAVANRKTILISGGTSSGKTTFLNALLKEVSQDERIVVVEDAPEIAITQPNAVGLVAVKGDLGEARISVDDLLQASLRLRPDRIIVGEIRGREAATFLHAINSGHPGSFSTVHANTPDGALEQIALMIIQSGLGLSRQETIDYISSLVDVVVQLSRHGGRRVISEIRCLKP